LGKKNTISAAEVIPAVKVLKAGEAVGCDEIQSELLKALNRERRLWLICVCQVA